MRTTPVRLRIADCGLRTASPVSRMSGSPRRAFTLVELMVVVGIIGLLAAIVLPAINNARIQAKKATTKATIGVIATGLESFNADSTVGGTYPPSSFLPGIPSPHLNGGTVTVNGASLLAWGLAGADLLGTPGFRDLNGVNDWMDDTGKAPGGMYEISTATQKPVVVRSGPFVDTDKMKFPKLVPGTNPPLFRIDDLPTKPGLETICFLDSFSQPIVYYRAAAGATTMVWDPLAGATTLGTYNLADNLGITGHNGGTGMDLGAGADHPISTLGAALPAAGVCLTLPASFARTVCDPNVTAVARPHNNDSYILLSPGPDGKYGTTDDIANFETNK